MQLPDQVLGARERQAATVASRNALIVDPEAQIEQEQLERPWAEDEKRILMDKFLQYPKVRPWQ